MQRPKKISVSLNKIKIICSKTSKRKSNQRIIQRIIQKIIQQRIIQKIIQKIIQNMKQFIFQIPQIKRKLRNPH